MNVWNNFSLHIDTFSLQTFAFFFLCYYIPKKGDRVETVSFDLCYYFYSKEYHGTDPNSYAFIFMSVTWIWLVGPLIRIVVRTSALGIKKVNIIPYRLVRPKFFFPASKPIQVISCFVPLFIPGCFGLFREVSVIPAEILISVQNHSEENYLFEIDFCR